MKGFNPNTYHQKAAQNSIAIGGIKGSGWKKSEFASRKDGFLLPIPILSFPLSQKSSGLIGVGVLLFFVLCFDIF